jgi:hypothetical protein
LPITPFIDRPAVNVGTVPSIPESIISTPAGTIGSESTTAASGDISPFIQGVSVKISSECFAKLTPFLSSFGFPPAVGLKINHEIERTTYGYVDLFINSDNCKTIEPYNDIDTLRDPVAFLKDSGITAYPQVMLSPNWLDPGMMNAIIEPLSVRGTLPGASIDSPFVAHTIRADEMISPIGYSYYNKYNDNNSYNKTPPFIDSQDVAIKFPGFYLAGDPIGDFGTKPIAPYDDSQPFILRNDLMTQRESIFNDFIGIGIISNKLSSTFDYGSERKVMRGMTGIRNVTRIDSLAFGGLMR